MPTRVETIGMILDFIVATTLSLWGVAILVQGHL